MNFTVIDFETANSKRESACAIGIVKVINGKITKQQGWLIRPKDMRFDSMNINIHGIRPEDVIDAPEFDVLYNTVLRDYIEGQMIVAHNAGFDMSVLRKSLDLYNIKYPTAHYLCTVKVAQKTWPLMDNHRLNTISDYLGFSFKHHDALDDSLACANVLLKAAKVLGASTPKEIIDQLHMQMGQVYPGGYKPCSIRK